MKTLIGITVANANNVDTCDVVDFLEANNKNFTAYSLAPAPKGSIRAAAFDCAIILNIAGDIASIAGLLWMAYDKFFANKKTQSDNSGIIIYFALQRDKPVQFWLGGQYKNKDVFVKDFTQSVDEMLDTTDPDEHNQLVAETMKNTNQWVPRKPKAGVGE
jgi:hypothetical protein